MMVRKFIIRIALMFIIYGLVMSVIASAVSAAVVDDAKAFGEIPAGIILGLTENVAISSAIQLFIVAVVTSIVMILILKLQGA